MTFAPPGGQESRIFPGREDRDSLTCNGGMWPGVVLHGFAYQPLEASLRALN